jgi:hypothetical protein
MKLKDHVELGNKLKDCLDLLADGKKRLKNLNTIRLAEDTISNINSLRDILNKELQQDHARSSATFIYFGSERSLLVNVEGVSEPVLCPIPKKESEKRKKRRLK